MEELGVDYYFEQPDPGLASLLTACDHVWDLLGAPLVEFVKIRLVPGREGRVMAGAFVDEDVYLGAGTVVEPGAYIKGPTIIGRDCEIRHGAYIRGGVWIGDHCVVGHATEVKNSIFLSGAKAGHFAYIGDSVLGSNVNLGAGTKLANLKIVRGTVSVVLAGQRFDSGLRKFGAILGDVVETGCNSVTSPGTMLGRRAMVYPCVNVRGFHPHGTVIKA